MGSWSHAGSWGGFAGRLNLQFEHVMITSMDVLAIMT